MVTLSRNNTVNSVELLNGQYRAKVLELFGLGCTIKDMRKHFPGVRVRSSTFSATIRSIVGDAAFATRYSKLLSDSQLGTNNTMSGRTGITHPTYVSCSEDGKGYLTVRKPKWWANRLGDRVYLHHFVYCNHYCLTELPKGMVLHHIDCDKLNNSIDNLLLCTPGQHTRIHWQLKQSVTTIPQGSTFKRMEAPCPYCT